jgi:hypothetical protein
VELNWTAPGDDGNVGTCALYEIYITSDSGDTISFSSARLISNPFAPHPAGSPETLFVGDLIPGTDYYASVRAADETYFFPNSWRVPFDTVNWSPMSRVASFTTSLYQLEGRNFIPLTGKFNLDSSGDICLLEPLSGNIYLAVKDSSRNRFIVNITRPLITNWCPGEGQFQFLVANVQGDDRQEIISYQAQFGRWFVGAFTDTSFYQVDGPDTLGSWINGFGIGAGLYFPLTGDFNNDGYWDVMAYQPEFGRWFVARNTGSSFVRVNGPYTGSSWIDCLGIANPDYIPKVVYHDSLQQQLLPVDYQLAQNYPNPFNSSTTITYSLPQAEHVSLIVYNILGEQVTVLVDEDQSAGEHSVTWNASGFASGVYLYRLATPNFSSSHKMSMLK